MSNISLRHQTVLQSLGNVGGFPAVSQHDHRTAHVFDQAVGGETADIVNRQTANNPARP